MKLFKLSLIIQIIKNPQIPKLNYENLEKLKKYNERFLTFGNWDAFVRLNLINHFVGFILCQFACNSALRNLVFRWESCKGSVCESVKKSLRVCTQQGLMTGSRNWLVADKSPKEAHM